MSDLVTLEAIELPDVAGDVADLTSHEAEQITNRIRRWANAFPAEDVVRAYRGRIWVALAYESWAEWCECELGGLKLPVPQRREVVAELAETGMSNRAIADVIGVDKNTVRTDLKSGGEYSPPAEVTGQDGKTYPRPEPKAVEPDEVIDAELVDVPAPVAPRRKPITEAFSAAKQELRIAVERVVRLAEDDRLRKNKDQIVGGCLSDLVRSRDALTVVIQQLEG